MYALLSCLPEGNADRFPGRKASCDRVALSSLAPNFGIRNFDGFAAEPDLPRLTMLFRRRDVRGTHIRHTGPPFTPHPPTRPPKKSLPFHGLGTVSTAKSLKGEGGM